MQHSARIAHHEDEPVAVPIPGALVTIDAALGQIEHHVPAFRRRERLESILSGRPVVLSDGRRKLRKATGPKGTGMDGLATGTRQILPQGVVEPEQLAGAKGPSQCMSSIRPSKVDPQWECPSTNTSENRAR